jgi:hypothetical protein
MKACVQFTSAQVARAATPEEHARQLPREASVGRNSAPWASVAGGSRIGRVRFGVGLVALLLTTAVLAEDNRSVDGVQYKGGQVYCLRGDELQPLTSTTIKLPFDVEVSTNGTFKVGEGKERKLGEGQIIRSDGWLVSPDGSVQPVFDHLAMLGGKALLVRDGQPSGLTEPMHLPNNSTIAPDQWCTRPDGTRARLTDGELFDLDGTPIPFKDAATLINGRVVTQRNGALIPLQPEQTSGMNEGSRVSGDGTVTRRDGSITRLVEGRTVLF